ncbi:MAG: ATP-binding protein [Pseudomonadota bacterium]
MLRNIFLGIAGILLAGLLVFLLVQSSAVDSEYYVDYGTRVNLLRQGETDYQSLAESLQSAYREGRAVPNSAVVLMRRIQGGRDELRAQFGSDEDPALLRAFEEFAAALEATSADFNVFVERQGQLASSVTTVRNESPSIVRDLRRFQMQNLAQNVFALAVEIMDYASGSGSRSREALLEQIAALENDPQVTGRLPGKLDGLIAAGRTVIEQRGAAADSLARLEASLLPGASRTLQATLRSINRSVVGRAERARTLLGVFSVLFLLGIGYTAVMLRRSYGELSDSKAALEVLNHSLEERVDARTEQLSTAYDELKESQTQLVHAEKMSSLGELVAGISHEINTPLWYLLSNATLLQERMTSFENFVSVTESLLDQLREGDKDKAKFVRRLQELDDMLLNETMRDDIEESTDLIRDSIEGLEQLAEMAQSLKDFSRLDRAAVDMFNVNDGLEKSLLIAKNFLKNRITVHKQYGEVPDIRCAPGQINQIFLNLIKNASDAMDDGGELTLTTRVDGDNVAIEVRDTGTGIPPEVLEKIRDPFFTTKEVGKGTGLGLSISDKIISAHAGSLEIDSVAGEGATFTVRLPIAQADGDSAAAELEAELDALDGQLDQAVAAG